MPSAADVVVIGAGQSGLAATRALQAHGIDPRSKVVSQDGPDARLLNDHDRQRSRTTRA